MRNITFVLTLALFSGCAAPNGLDLDAINDDAAALSPPLADVDVLLAGLPTNDELPIIPKDNTIFPETFDLVATQTPVKSQGRRGVCSIFSTVALMEHLYVTEGTITNPDFSEQYLQWSAKFEVGAFKNTSGSNARSNIEAINRFGIVEEQAWKYESSGWTTADDEECDGEDRMPTRCYTNGEPPEEALSANKWHLPRGRSINSSTRNIKDHMTSTNTAAVVGLTFFYQAWNHGGSSLPIVSDYSKKGYILYPNKADKEASLEKRAGHSILLVGWDDNLEVQRVDEEGELMFDEDGEPIVEKGFFLFKNSWGADRFGTGNPKGAGYGWLSYKYVSEYGRVQTSEVPEVDIEPVVEICDDGVDNDDNGQTDCDDMACASEPSCEVSDEVINVTSEPGLSIPDNDDTGVSDVITITDDGQISELTVAVHVAHTYSGDLTITLSNGQTEAVLHNRTGGSADDVREFFTVEDFEGASAAGTWTLTVTDHAGYDVGDLVSWGVSITLK